MKITQEMLAQATRAGVLQPGQGDRLWAFLALLSPAPEVARAHEPRFKPAHILYYLGGLVALGAMTLFMNLAWEQLGPWALAGIAALYAFAAALGAEWLLKQKRLPLPAGLLAALAVALVPLAMYGLQQALGWWPDTEDGWAYRDYFGRIDGRWVLMETAALVAAVCALYRWRLPFAVLPLAMTLWFLSMDIVPLLLGGERAGIWSEEGRRISTAFGAAMLLGALWVDLRTRHGQDFAFWLYVFGMLTFWGGLTSLPAGGELTRLGYALLNLGLIAIGAALSRRVFAVFGALGVAIYLGHLSYTVFRDSLLFPLALSAIGLGVMALGVWWQRHELALGARLRGLLPQPLRELVELRGHA
jgi:hypothetical protein